MFDSHEPYPFGFDGTPTGTPQPSAYDVQYEPLGSCWLDLIGSAAASLAGLALAAVAWAAGE